VFLTGFSGGGSLVYRMVVRHPDRLAAAMPVCANFIFWNHGYRNEGNRSAEDRDDPVRVINGSRDAHGRYFIGGLLLPSLPWALGLVICGGTAASYGVWRRTRKPRRTATVAAGTVLLLVLIVVNRWAGIEVQTESAVQLLGDLGYTNVERTTIPDMGHEPAPERVVHVLTTLRPTISKGVR
jgi:hypothetical protein